MRSGAPIRPTMASQYETSGVASSSSAGAGRGSGAGRGRNGGMDARRPPEGAPHGGQHEHLVRLGQALNARADDVVAGMIERSRQSGVLLDEVVEDSFARVGTVSTIAVARWMAGEGADVAREVEQESWGILGQLAAQRAAPLHEVTKRCLRWRDAAEEVVRETGTELRLAPDVLVWALGMLQRSLDVTLVRMCQSFESERQRATT